MSFPSSIASSIRNRLSNARCASVRQFSGGKSGGAGKKSKIKLPSNVKHTKQQTSSSTSSPYILQSSQKSQLQSQQVPVTRLESAAASSETTAAGAAANNTTQEKLFELRFIPHETLGVLDYSVPPKIYKSPPAPPARVGKGVKPTKYVVPFLLSSAVGFCFYLYFYGKDDNIAYWKSMETGGAFLDDDDDEEEDDEEE